MNEMPSSADILTQLNIQPVHPQLLTDYPPVVCIPNGASMLHEESHVMRVMVYADLICQKIKKQGLEVNRHAILSAIRIHDSYRRQEYEDEEDHGLVASVAADMSGIFKDDPDEGLIYFLATWHSEDDSKVPLLSKESFPLELAILKDADALDRYRDAHHNEVDENGPDPAYFRLDVTHKLMPIAESLCAIYFNPKRQKDDNRPVAN